MFLLCSYYTYCTILPNKSNQIKVPSIRAIGLATQRRPEHGTFSALSVERCSGVSIICLRVKIWSMVERPGMKTACCIRLHDLIAETDLRRRISARSFPGIDRRLIPQRFAQVRQSPLRFQNGSLRQSSGIFSLIQTQLIITV